MKRILLLVALLMAVAFVASLGETPMVKANAITTVQQAKLAGADASVSLNGQIVAKLGTDEFILRDNTGEILVKADAESVAKLHLEPEAMVSVKGSVESDMMLTEVEAESIVVN